jgi:enolase
MKEAIEKIKNKKEQVKKIKATIQQIETRGKKKKKILDIQETIVTPTQTTKMHTQIRIQMKVQHQARKE